MKMIYVFLLTIFIVLMISGYTFATKKNKDQNIDCIAQYKPVCASVLIPCEAPPCKSIQKTFSNRCVLDKTANTLYLYEGECH